MRENMGVYRGKRLDNGKWIEGSLWLYGEDAYIDGALDFSEDFWIKVDPSTVGQYTGLTVNGKRIFEGDIIECVDRYYNSRQQESIHTLCVKYFMGNPCACFPGGESGEPLYPLCVGISIEVIGNIHDNPELLEV